ncbi:hypothetical protein Tco_0670498 [Tanacetum coccineum]
MQKDLECHLLQNGLETNGGASANLSLLSSIAFILGYSASLGVALRAAHGWLCKSKGSFVPISSMYKDKLENTAFGSKLVATAEDDKPVARYGLLVKKNEWRWRVGLFRYPKSGH